MNVRKFSDLPKKVQDVLSDKEPPKLRFEPCPSCECDPCDCNWGNSIRAVGDKDPTNFPKKGDNKKVSLRTSQYKIFPISFAEKIRTKYPSIWKKGGNIKGNAQYKILKKIQQKNNGSSKTTSQEAAIRLREAWMARHLKDFRIAGVIAQIKWLGIGSRGLQYMKNLVREEMRKQDKKSKHIDTKSCIKDSGGDTMLKDLKKVSYRNIGGKKEWTLKSRNKIALDSVGITLGKMEIREAEKIDPNERSIFVVEGIASSTSIDSYGTEMSRDALINMKEQMDKGIPILPRHNSATASGVAEWDEVVGRTVGAEIRTESVKKAAKKSERQHVLLLRSQLYADNKLSQDLVKRLNRGEPIGQSIGGWFDQVRVMENSEGIIERVIVDQVTLDHVAITRAPAKPDSDGLVHVRNKHFLDLRGRRMTDLRILVGKTEESGNLNLPEERHIAEVIDDGDFVIVKYKKMPIEEDKSELNELNIPDKKYDDLEEEEEEEEEDMSSIKEYADEEYDDLEKEEEEEEEDMSSIKEYTDEEYDKSEKEEEEEEEEDMSNLSFDRSAIPYSNMPIAPMDTLWKFGVKEQEEILGQDNDWKKYRMAHLYVVKDGGDNKQDYKLPIARMVDGELKVVYKGLISAMAALNGARGGVKMPESDRKSIYSNIKKYYSLFDKEAPELKSEDEYNLVLQGSPDESEGARSTRPEHFADKEQLHSLNSDQNVENSIDKVNKTIQNKSDTFVDGDTMTENDLKSLAVLIQNSLKPLSDRMDSLEASKAKDEVTEVDKYSELEAKLKRTEAQLERVIEKPIRRGYHFNPKGNSNSTRFTDMIQYSRVQGSNNIAQAVERTEKKLEDKNTSASQLEDILKVTLRAAVADGLIGG